MTRYFLDDNQEAMWASERAAVDAARIIVGAVGRPVLVKRWYKPGRALDPIISVVGTMEMIRAVRFRRTKVKS